ncbi:AEC family transporter [Clostridium aciditolerans]|uniref:AEC family transporter n=1 Tax=Clostridium aciditolerans TaxID=339861 RepID=A0A934I1P3_9CLOT|nr:AEC family transporter [Clostridium aciditolerans]MBI6874405.1 AEC family transporter [Clostridium aciditolerans]
MTIMEIINSLCMIFIMIIPGIIFRKKELIDTNQSKGISTVVVNLTWPCLVIDAMQVKFSQEIFKRSQYIFVVVLLVFAIAFIVGFLLVKMLKIKREQGGIFAFMLVFANTGFMGIPVINALYGKEAVFYASIIEMVNDIMLFTVGIMLIQLSAGIKTKISFKEFLTPGIIGVIIGYVMFLCNFQLPGFLGHSVNIIGAATTPLTMFVIGVQVGELRFKELLGNGAIYVMSFVKLLIIPIIALLIMRFIFNDSSLLAKVLIISFAMPVAACTTIFSQQYNADVGFATKGVLLSTVVSVATIPIFAMILR